MTFQHLGEALVLLRKRQSLKQHEVARRADITRPMLSAYETGKQLPSLTTLERLLTALDVDLFDLARAIASLEAPVLPEESPHVDQADDTPTDSLHSLAPEAFQAFETALSALVREVFAEQLREVQSRGAGGA